MGPEADTDLRERLDQIDRDYRKRARENRRLILVFARRTFAILAILVVVQLAVGGWSAYLTSQNEDRSTETRQLVLAVQGQRADAVRSNCEDSNKRHDGTIKQLDRLVAQIKSPARRERAKQGRAGTVALIDALAPKRDCGRLVAKLAAPVD